MELIYPLSKTMMYALGWCVYSFPLWILVAILWKRLGGTEEESWAIAVAHFRVATACFWLFFPVSCWEHSQDDTPYNHWPEGCNQYTGECPKDVK